MDIYKKLFETLRSVGGNNNIALVIGTVKEITGESCTVDFGTADEPLEITEVRLKSTLNEAGNYLLIIPKEGTKVTCGSVSGDLTDLCVLKVDEMAQLKYVQDGLEIMVDSTDGKVSIKNGTTGLLELMTDLVNIFKNLKVFTPSGPSGTPLPTTMSALTQFENKFKSILK